MNSISERLGLGTEVRDLKLGRSFTKNSGSAFHSFRYDFKPASVDTTKGATVEIGEGHQVMVTLPHVEGTAQTVFRGSKKPCQKECVLIIDHNTGEITLEKLSYNIQLKKTRAEGSSKVQQQVRPITPIDSRKSSPSGQKLSPTWLGAKGGTTSSPGNSNNKGSSHWPASSSSSPAAPPQTSPSMPCILSNNNNGGSNSSASNSRVTTLSSTKSGGGTPSTQHSDAKPAPSAFGLGDVGVLSESSSNESSSSEGSDSEFENVETETRGPIQSSAVASDSMPKFPLISPSMPAMPTIMQPSVTPSMTKYNSLLSEDLQLSESGSDCDD